MKEGDKGLIFGRLFWECQALESEKDLTRIIEGKLTKFSSHTLTLS
jgi:hypothetical protein